MKMPTVIQNFGIFLKNSDWKLRQIKMLQLKQISLYIQSLEDNGTRLNENITKHLDDDIWELRPGNNRVLYFYFKDDTFVLLHQFRKKTQKTPKREIERAKAERDDYLRRKEADWLWEPGMITKNMLNLLIPKSEKIWMK